MVNNLKKMKLKDLIKQTRRNFGESQEQFAIRFKTTANTISRWETGIYEVPNVVVEALLEDKYIKVICPYCMGNGTIKKLDIK